MNTNPIHLYRWLLRECSYLPDPKARLYMKGYVTQRFRRHIPPETSKSATQTSENRRNASQLSLARQVKLLHNGRKLLSGLSRANQGYLQPLQNVLRMTYGRTGRRRRELMDKLYTPSSQSNLAKGSSTTDRTSSLPTLTDPRLVSLIYSQARHQSYLPESAVLRDKPKLPEPTTKGVPVTRRKIDKATLKWHAKTLGLLQPPLSEHEFREIHDVVMGMKPWPELKKRRHMVGRDVDPSGRGTTDSELSKFLFKGADNTGSHSQVVLLGRPHKITGRLMRRLLAKTVLVTTPLLTTRVSGDIVADNPFEAETRAATSKASPSTSGSDTYSGDSRASSSLNENSEISPADEEGLVESKVQESNADKQSLSTSDPQTQTQSRDLPTSTSTSTFNYTPTTPSTPANISPPRTPSLPIPPDPIPPDTSSTHPSSQPHQTSRDKARAQIQPHPQNTTQPFPTPSSPSPSPLPPQPQPQNHPTQSNTTAQTFTTPSSPLPTPIPKPRSKSKPPAKLTDQYTYHWEEGRKSQYALRKVSGEQARLLFG